MEGEKKERGEDIGKKREKTRKAYDRKLRDAKEYKECTKERRKRNERSWWKSDSRRHERRKERT